MNSVVAGGTETTAHTMRVITYHLCQNPDMLQKLRAELKRVDLSSKNARKLSQLEQLPYLYAILNEGLRLSYGVVSRLHRIAPDRVIEYGEWKIPPGTPVSMSAGLIHLDPNAFPQPHTFDPERWMNPAERRRLEKYMVPFSKGTRVCLGLKYASVSFAFLVSTVLHIYLSNQLILHLLISSLAWAELYLTIAILFSRFDFSLHETTNDDIAFAADQWLPGHKSHNGVRVTIKIV